MRLSFLKNRKLSLLALSLATGVVSVNAQSDRYWGQPDIPVTDQRGFGLGANFGLADMWGDVGTKSPVDHYVNNKYWKDLHFMGGAFIRYTHLPGLSFRLGGNYGMIYADDKWNEQKALKADHFEDDEFQRYLRNLNARSTIWEANLLVEIAPMRLFSNWEFSRSASRRFQPYLLLGVARTRFNTQGLYKDFVNETQRWVDLRPLHTEGQGYNLIGMPDYYSRFTWAAVGGLGIKWDVGRGLGLGLEWQLRYAFTDYLDDVSGKYIDPIYHEIALVEDYPGALVTNRMMDKSYEIIPGYKNAAGVMRGDPDNNDMYSTLNIQFYWKIDSRKIKWWSSLRRR